MRHPSCVRNQQIPLLVQETNTFDRCWELDFADELFISIPDSDRAFDV